MVAVHEVVVQPILHKGRLVGYAIEAPAIRVILRKQEDWFLSAVEPAPPERRMLRLNHAIVTPRRANPQAGTGAVMVPGPGVAEPERGQEVEFGGVRSTIAGGGGGQGVAGRGLGVFGRHVKIAGIGGGARGP